VGPVDSATAFEAAVERNAWERFEMPNKY
jgi:hypothetical protein